MPLDPFFAERLRVHRRYLLGQALGRAKVRLAVLWPFGARGEAARADAGIRRPEAAAAAGSAAGHGARARAKHRRAALAWDRTELRTAGTPGPELRTTEHTVSVPGQPSVRVRVYDPRDDLHGPAVPAVLAFFGGAFRIGGIDYPTTDAGYRRRAADARVAIVAVDYALAPEHRFPTQVEQAQSALRWLFDNSAALGIDPERVGIAGSSAGANIAASLAILNRDTDALPLRLQLLEVPVVDLTGRHLDLRATRALGIPTPIALRELRSVARTYLPRHADARDPRASPLRAASHADLPPAVVLTAEYDPLRGDGEAYLARLREDGVDASGTRYLGVTHDVAIFTGALPAARRWHADVVAALRSLHD
ncbi:alpha/beta hydrolase [Microbacterium terricola]|uniref:Alpha/beta hydrolase fold-3 domain-containing protein n=1 Tax=Microbacterium terricola TaxID=344163 RepID=A0ABM8E2Z7_9MICO|nr:alpha/beta hydrolase [Microbacterium terricola]UYK39972.1 alpha/beta hydrolase [Microbacterium terricola]BDV32344.1 hypothetical protein Microterr_30040 [Microbacterium terricola]